MTEQANVPQLHPAPGRCIIRIVPRIGLDGSLKTQEGLALALDGKYETQPMLGVMVSIGDPTNDREREIAKWAKERAEAGDVFVFSQYGTGSPYWNDEMRKMLTAGYDFRWLQGLRLYDLNQLGATIQGCGEFGEVNEPKPSLIEVVQ